MRPCCVCSTPRIKRSLRHQLLKILLVLQGKVVTFYNIKGCWSVNHKLGIRALKRFTKIEEFKWRFKPIVGSKIRIDILNFYTSILS